ncbi:hypothetical protein [Nonomuraea sp. NPDC003804]
MTSSTRQAGVAWRVRAITARATPTSAAATGRAAVTARGQYRVAA